MKKKEDEEERRRKKMKKKEERRRKKMKKKEERRRRKKKEDEDEDEDEARIYLHHSFNLFVGVVAIRRLLQIIARRYRSTILAPRDKAVVSRHATSCHNM